MSDVGIFIEEDLEKVFNQAKETVLEGFFEADLVDVSTFTSNNDKKFMKFKFSYNNGENTIEKLYFLNSVGTVKILISDLEKTGLVFESLASILEEKLLLINNYKYSIDISKPDKYVQVKIVSVAEKTSPVDY